MDTVVIERRMMSLRTLREILTSLRALSSIQYRYAQETLQEQRALELDLRAAVAAVAAPRPPVKDPAQVLLLVFGSDQGFCGPLIRRVVDVALERLESGPGTPLAIGARTRDLLSDALGHPVPFLPFTASPKSLDPLVDAIGTAIETRIAAMEVDGVEAVYARHEAPGRSPPAITRLFPVDPAILPRRGPPTRLFEPADVVLGRLLFEWVYAELYRVVLEAQAAEHGARMQTTDAATRAIDERLDALAVDHHRARQAQATAEVQEIMAAAEVMLYDSGRR